MIDAVLLAAGTSTRMGETNKLLLKVKNIPIVERVVRQLLTSKVNKIVVVLGHEHDKVANLLNKYPVDFILNASYRKGQTSSVQAAMSMLSDKSDAFMVCLSDMPLLTGKDYDFLIEKYNQQKSNIARPIVRPVYKNNIGNPVVFDKVYKSHILNCDAVDGCREVIQMNRNNYRPIQVNQLKYFFDIDSRDDYERYVRSSS